MNIDTWLIDALYAAKESDYFIAECKQKEGRPYLVFFSLTQSQRVILEKPRESLALTDAEKLLSEYMDANIYVYPKLPPFQVGQPILRITTFIQPVKWNEETMSRLVASDATTAYELKKELEAPTAKELIANHISLNHETT